jgi:hypothetical protein
VGISWASIVSFKPWKMASWEEDNKQQKTSSNKNKTNQSHDLPVSPLPPLPLQLVCFLRGYSFYKSVTGGADVANNYVKAIILQRNVAKVQFQQITIYHSLRIRRLNLIGFFHFRFIICQ